MKNTDAAVLDAGPLILNDLPKRSTLHLKPALLQKILASLPEK